MLQIQCNTCRAQAFVDCVCPETHPAHVIGHLDECPVANLDAQVVCACCPDDHDHAAAAMACPGIPGDADNHPGAKCPAADPDHCPVFQGGYSAATGPAVTGTCPGGHCGLGVKGCTICRPVTITLLPGTVTLQPAPGA